MANSFKHYVIIFLLISHIFLILKKIEKSIKLKNNEELNKLEYKRKIIEKKLEIAKLYTELTYEYKYLEKIVKYSNNSSIEKNESSIDTNYSSIEKNESSIVNESSIDTNYSSIDKNEYIERLLDQIPIYDPKTKFVKLSQLEKDKFCKTHYGINALDIRLELLEKYIFGEISREVSINTRINNLLFNVSNIINNTYLQNKNHPYFNGYEMRSGGFISEYNLEPLVNLTKIIIEIIKTNKYINNNNSIDQNLYVINKLENLASTTICLGFYNYTTEQERKHYCRSHLGINALKHRLFLLVKFFKTKKQYIELKDYEKHIDASTTFGRDINLWYPFRSLGHFRNSFLREHMDTSWIDEVNVVNNSINTLERKKTYIICKY